MNGKGGKKGHVQYMHICLTSNIRKQTLSHHVFSVDNILLLPFI